MKYNLAFEEVIMIILYAYLSIEWFVLGPMGAVLGWVGMF